MRYLLLIPFLLLTCGIGYADESTPPSPPKEIQAAVQKCDEATKQAEDAYRKAVVAAKGQLLKDVQTQLQVAMKDGKLDVAKALDAVKAQVEGDVKFLNFKGIIVRVDARGFTKIMPVNKGQTYKFTAVGKWSMVQGDPNAFSDADGLNKEKGGGGTLMAKVGTTTLAVGKQATVIMPEDGMLELGPYFPSLARSSGFVTVRIEAAEHDDTK